MAEKGAGIEGGSAPGMQVFEHHTHVGGGGGGAERRRSPRNLTFPELVDRLNEPGVGEDEKKYLNAVKDRAVEDIESLDGGNYLEDLRNQARDVLASSPWNGHGGVVNTLRDLAREKDEELKANGGKKSWEGLIPFAMEGELAELKLGGIQQREGGNEDALWRRSHGYSERGLNRLRETLGRHDVLDLLPVNAERIVGTNIGTRTATITNPIETVGDTGPVRDRRGGVLDRMDNIYRERATAGEGNFTPEEYARAMGVPNPEQQRELYIRAEEEMVVLPALDLEVPSFLLGRRGTVEELIQEQKEWKARARLTTAAANKRMAPSYDKIFPNQEMIDFTREDLRSLMEKDGVMEAASAYIALIVHDKDPNEFFGRRGLVSSIFEIKNKGEFSALRDAMREWLTQRFSPEDARVAEHIAWNLMYVSNVLEEFDSNYEHAAYKHREHLKRIPPVISQFKAQPVWMMMHPQERLQGKVGGGEAFSRFGEWGLNRTKGLLASKELPQILPKTMFRNALREIKIGSRKSLFDVLEENASFLGGRRGARYTFGRDVDWENIGEGPFGNYCFDTLSPAIKVFATIDKGLDRDMRLSQLGDALRKLGVSKKERENILMGLNGISNKSRALKPIKGWGWWGDYKRGLRKYAPNFFK